MGSYRKLWKKFPSSINLPNTTKNIFPWKHHEKLVQPNIPLAAMSRVPRLIEERRQTDSSDDDEKEIPNLSVQTHSCLQLSKHLWEEEEELEKKNLCFSPMSIYVILSLIASGSSGRTLEQMLEFLNSDSIDRLNSIGSQLIESVTGGGGGGGGDGGGPAAPSLKKQKKRKRTSSTEGGGGGPTMFIMNRVWVEKSPCALKPHYNEIVRSIYKAKAKSVDFTTQANEVRKKVNKWVKKKTNGLIEELLPHGSIGGNTRLVLANALYFKGEWNQEFDPTETKKYKFHLLNGVGSVQVPFMTNNKKQFVSCFEGFKVLKLPYKEASTNDRRFSMYIFLPDERDGLGNLVQKANSDSGFLDRHIPKREVKMGEFRIPKFKISFGFEASKVLKKLGVVSPFDSSEAELDEMVDGENNRRLYVSSIHHKCFVEVDEVGTEAAAATTSVFTSCCAVIWKSTVDFVADHPFMFFIRDDETGGVLFMGHILNPL